MAYRANPENRNEEAIANQAHGWGAPVFIDGGTKVIAKGNNGAPEKIFGATTSPNPTDKVGVVMPHDDKPGLFLSDKQGRA